MDRRTSGTVADAPGPADAGIESLRRQLSEALENLRLLQERKAEYVMSTDVPLQLIKEERRLLERIEELEQAIGSKSE